MFASIHPRHRRGRKGRCTLPTTDNEYRVDRGSGLCAGFRDGVGQAVGIGAALCAGLNFIQEFDKFFRGNFDLSQY